MAHNGSETSPPPPTEEVQTAESAVTVAGNIDLLTLILTHLEAKPLIRFKSISKQWLSLISSPNFSRLHILRNPNPKPSSLFFLTKLPNYETAYEFVSLVDSSSPPRPPPFRSLPFCPDGTMTVVSSCNGLLLCSTDYISVLKKENYVFNPATKQFSRLLPPAGYDDWMSDKSHYHLAFDPLRSPHYKVIMVRSEDIFRKDVSKRFELHIYSSETRSWKMHKNKFKWPLFNQGVYLNGVMHWPSQNGGFMCFDIDLELITQVILEPPCFRSRISSSIRYFGESCGDLHSVYVHGYGIYVFVYKRDYSCSFKYMVDIKLLMASYPRMIGSVSSPIRIEDYNFSLLSILKLGDDQDEQLVLHVAGKVISYSFKTNSIKVLRDSLPGEVYKIQNRPRSFDAHLYFDTFACA